jgi:hypothetical protein
MRFLVSARYRDDVIDWIRANHTSTKRSQWFPYFRLSTGFDAIMVNVDTEDALAFALTFEHEKIGKK